MRALVSNALVQIGCDAGDIVTAEDPLQALDLMAADKFDCVLSDWNMPNMLGIDFVRKLRADGNVTPFGFITSDGSPTSQYQATEAGAQFLVKKPFKPEDIAAQLKRVGLYFNAK